MAIKHPLAKRFRGYYPVVIDVETGGFNAEKDALLEIAAITLTMDEDGYLHPHETFHEHIKPFEGANLDPKALEFTGIDPYHPFRLAIEEKEALQHIFKAVRAAQKEADCQRSVLVGHNAAFDISFLNAAVKRCDIKRNPFHAFTTFDTATLSAVCLGQTVLARAVLAANLPFNQEDAHSALYDADRTAALFCYLVNRWQELGGWKTLPPQSSDTPE